MGDTPGSAGASDTTDQAVLPDPPPLDDLLGPGGVAFGQQLMADGLVTEQVVRRAIGFQRLRKAETGKKPALGEVLVHGGFVSPDEIRSVLKRLTCQVWLVCQSCNNRFYFPRLPEPAQEPPCLLCGGPLDVVSSIDLRQKRLSAEAFEEPTDPLGIGEEQIKCCNILKQKMTHDESRPAGSGPLFGELALEAGLISKDVLDGALTFQKMHEEETGQRLRLGGILAGGGFLTDDQINDLLNRQLPSD